MTFILHTAPENKEEMETRLGIFYHNLKIAGKSKFIYYIL